MRRLALVALFAGAAASARPWNGIEPGATSREEVLRRFGEPSRVVTPSESVEVLAYLKEKAIKGTTQVQFKIDVRTQRVLRIDVFPLAAVDVDAVENTYGRACPAGPPPESPCYLKKVTEDFRVYFHYHRAGMAIFFEPDGRTVNSLIFEPPKGPGARTAQSTAP